MIAVIPLRGFDHSKTRLAASLEPTRRREVAASLAGRVAGCARRAGCEVVVVSSAHDVAAWCGAKGLTRVPDPGGGLDTAAAAGIATTSGPWVVIHGDLPLLTPHDLAPLRSVDTGRVVLAPSRDGGTNAIASTGPFPFAYGPGSFHRHLARAAGRRREVVVRVGLTVELDTPADLAAVLGHPEGEWLASLLS